MIRSYNVQKELGELKTESTDTFFQGANLSWWRHYKEIKNANVLKQQRKYMGTGILDNYGLSFEM